jgi:hypothetical protein
MIKNAWRSNNRFERKGNWSKWGSKGTGDGQFKSTGGIAVDSSGNVYVGDGDRIQKFALLALR